ncbi:MAG: flavodoxin-dependent (E)-4-hydroxy-3-methylbut-2-enyl-diphosphate synthase, partial [Clostridia bacterium]|nr:flavodoxin-dependent (E)-4-hydroxy-3-methylbut-2-enyl-diphosphate synthase [Clostridia bacterium]
NGPGEAREADIGIAGGEDEALLFAHGRPIGKYPAAEIIDRLIEKLKKTARDADLT